MVLLAGVGSGCGALIGLSDVPEPTAAVPDSSAEGAPDTALPTPDAPAETSPGVDTGTDADANAQADSGDAHVETGPPPTPAKPGFDITAGGGLSKSTHYVFVGAAGESPGWNGVSLSTSYSLHGGVVGSTQ
jgi:hypothetical protein